jgi:transcriptional regulator with XRE-family HTH domain
MDEHKPEYRHYLKEWRIKRGLSREQLAGLAGVPPWQIAAWERGQHRVHTQDQFRLMIALGIEPTQRFEWPGMTDVKRFETVLREVSDMSDERRALLLQDFKRRLEKES